MLATRALPPAVRLLGWYKYLVLAVAGLTCGLGVWGGIASLFN
jgi:hypothetical protein